MLAAFWEVTKPRVVALLALEALAGGALAARGTLAPHTGTILAAGACVWLGAAGAEALTNTIDRDIDARMRRTCARALPAGRLAPSQAMGLGSVLVAAAFALAAPLGVWPALYLALGLFDNVVVYNLLTKRHTPWSAVLGAFSGGAPALIGYAAVAHGVGWLGWLLAGTVILWTPVHVWTLAWRHGADYRAAGVPIPSNVWHKEPVAACVGGCALLVASLGAILAFGSGEWVAVVGAAGGAAALASPTWRLWRLKDAPRATAVFRAANLYLALLLCALIVGGLAIKIQR